MASNRERVLDELLIGPALDSRGEEYLVTSLSYSKGGPNYFSGGTDPRGYCVGVQPLTKQERSTSYMLFSGVRTLILPAQAFSQKKLDALQADPALVKKLQRHVLTKLRDEARRRFEQYGGRGIEQADRIDRLEALLGETSDIQTEG